MLLDDDRTDRSEQDELELLALSGDPDAPIPADAVPWTGREHDGPDLLPDWYMPAPMVGRGQLTGWRRRVAWLVIIAALAVVASGLCNTYGDLVIA